MSEVAPRGRGFDVAAETDSTEQPQFGVSDGSERCGDAQIVQSALVAHPGKGSARNWTAPEPYVSLYVSFWGCPVQRR